jgi:polygalacturonase
MRFPALRSFLTAAPVFFSLSLCAQDARTVTEPHIPAASVTLRARIAAVRGVIPAAEEQSLDTARIQNAIDNCAPGKAVVLRNDGARNVFLIGPINLRSNVTLVVAANTALVASRNPRLFDLAPGTCGILATRGGGGCKPLISAENVENSGIMGAGSIDGRGGAALLGQNVTWWQLAHAAKVKDESQHVFRLLIISHARNFTLYNITLRNSPATHVGVVDTDGFTAWGVKIMTPGTARNTDGIDPHSSRNITIEHCFIHAGDDNVAVGSSHGAPSSNISILHNHFYTGHGMSIGSPTSGGVDHMLVDDLTIDGAQNGIRIKSDPSRGGFVHDITYRNVCIRNVTNPLVFSPHYTTRSGNLLPVYTGIALDHVRILTPGTYTFMGLDPDHKLELNLNNVFAEGLQQSRIIGKDAAITIGKFEGNLEPTGDGVTIQQTPGSASGTPLACAARFVPFPSDSTAPAMAVIVPPVDHTYYVAADGTGDYYSIQQAINAVPATGHATIAVAPGTYREVLTIDKPDIQLRSANPDPGNTIIVNNRSAGANGGTLHSATVNVTADNFFAENITFENDFNRTHPQLYQGSQALALLVTGDRAVFHNVRVLANQDTLYLGSRNCRPDGQNCKVSRQFFSASYIAGNVDFIFGDAKAAFDRCQIHSTQHSEGFLTAQAKHYPTEDSGFVIDHSKLTAEPGLTGTVYLGRPWRPYATAIYLNTEMGDQINPAGWREWHPGETHSLDTAFFAEYNSTGPGAHPGEREARAHTLNAQQAKKYAPATWLRGNDNWNPYLLPRPLTIY